MNKNTKIFIFGAVTMLFALWCIGCQLASDQAAAEEDWYAMVKCDVACIGSCLLYCAFIDLKSFESLRHDLDEARARIQELEELEGSDES